MSPAAVRAAVPNGNRRTLWIRHAEDATDTVAPFCIDGRTVYEPGYRMICWLMRDRHVPAAQGYVHYDIVEIEALWEVQRALALNGIYRPLVITSGYRSPETNAATEGAARNSMHLYAKAADMYVEGVSMQSTSSTHAGRARFPAVSVITTITFTSIRERVDGGWVTSAFQNSPN